MLSKILKNKFGFTLAEVLITLGIIGVVAAMTLPALTTKYQKIVVESKLKKFYSIMQQAVRIAESEYGDYPSWAPTRDMANSADKLEEWYNKYLDTQIDSQYKKKLDSRFYQVGLKDGSGFAAYIMPLPLPQNYIAIMYCTEMKYCGVEKYDGVKSFLFYLAPSEKEHNYFVTHGVGNTREYLLNGCKYGNYDNPDVSSMGRRHTCAALIEKDGWRIKNDYPWKQLQVEK